MAHPFLSEAGAVPAIKFSVVPARKLPRRRRRAPLADSDSDSDSDSEAADHQALEPEPAESGQQAADAECELERRLLEQVQSAAALVPLTGFAVATDAITEGGAAQLLTHIDAAPWVRDRDGRRVQVRRKCSQLALAPPCSVCPSLCHSVSVCLRVSLSLCVCLRLSAYLSASLSLCMGASAGVRYSELPR